MTRRWARPTSRRLTRRALFLACAAVGAVAALAVPAFAYFTVPGGSGAGSASTGSLQPLVIKAATTGTPSSTLTPGTTADLLLNVTNPNAATVTIVSIAQGGGVTVVGGALLCGSDPAWPTTLGTSGVSVATKTGLSIPVAGGASVVVHIPGGAAMGTNSGVTCQGKTFQIPVTVAIQQ
jgi:hypothetical protein